MKRSGTVTTLLLIGACALIACGSSAKPSPGPNVPAPTTSSSPGPGGTPDALIGMWRVTSAAGEPADTVMRLSSGDGADLILFRSCGDFLGDWTATVSGAFVGYVTGFSQACLEPGSNGKNITPVWMAESRAFRVRGTERELLATNGTVLARLVPVKQPLHPTPDLLKDLRQPPTHDPITMHKLRTVPQPLPATVTPATPTTILGRWVPFPKRHYQNGQTPYLAFDKDGSWSGSDGCNGSGGPWVLASGGELVTTSGPSTLIGCDGAPTGAWLLQARRAAVAGERLILYDAAGRLVARLTR
jgi:hypothetical protein